MATNPRPGFTRTGKSLKAVRRYYALKAAGKLNQDQGKQEQTLDTSPRSPPRLRSKRPDELSKRIAAELQDQKDANEKRGIELEMPTERSALPDSAVVKELTPAFVLKTSQKTHKSGVAPPTALLFDEFGYPTLSVIITCLLFGVIYVLTWILMIIFSSTRPQSLDPKLVGDLSSFSSIQWLALSSMAIIAGISGWFYYRKVFKRSLASLGLMCVGAISVLVYVIMRVFNANTVENEKGSKRFETRNPLNFWLSTIYFVYIMLVTALMTLQVQRNYSALKDSADDKSKSLKVDAQPNVSNVFNS